MMFDMGWAVLRQAVQGLLKRPWEVSRKGNLHWDGVWATEPHFRSVSASHDRHGLL